MALFDLKTLLSENSYPGRGIVIGKSFLYFFSYYSIFFFIIFII